MHQQITDCACAASVLFWPSSEKNMPHTSASVFCRTFHIEAASVDIHLLSILFSFLSISKELRLGFAYHVTR